MPVSSSVSTTTFRTSDRKVNYLVARHLALPRELHTLTGNLCESHPRLEFGSNCSRRTPPPVENSAFGPPASSLYSFTLTARPTTRIIMAQRDALLDAVTTWTRSCRTQKQRAYQTQKFKVQVRSRCLFLFPLSDRGATEQPYLNLPTVSCLRLEGGGKYDSYSTLTGHETEQRPKVTNRLTVTPRRCRLRRVFII